MSRKKQTQPRFLLSAGFSACLSNCQLTAHVLLDVFLLLVDKSKSSLFQAPRKQGKRLERREDGEVEHVKHCCHNFNRLRQHLRQSLGFALGFARRVKQTWRACETHRTFPHFKISFFLFFVFSFLVFWHENGFLEAGRVVAGLRQPRPQSSSAIADMMSPVKLVDRARFQASYGNSDSANWPGHEAGTEVFKRSLQVLPSSLPAGFCSPRSFAARPTALTESLVLAKTKTFLSAGTDLTLLSCKFCDVLSISVVVLPCQWV